MINLNSFGLSNEKVQIFLCETLDANIEVVSVSISASGTYLTVHGRFDGEFEYIEVDVVEVQDYFEGK